MEQGIRKQIKLSREAYKNFTGKDIEELFGYLPLHQFDIIYHELRSRQYNQGAVESAVGIVRRFNEQEMEAFIEILKEEGKCLKICLDLK